MVERRRELLEHLPLLWRSRYGSLLILDALNLNEVVIREPTYEDELAVQPARGSDWFEQISAQAGRSRLLRRMGTDDDPVERTGFFFGVDFTCSIEGYLDRQACLLLAIGDEPNPPVIAVRLCDIQATYFLYPP